MAQADYVSNAIHALITGAGAKPSTNPVRTAHAEFVVAVAGHPPWPIPLGADASDVEDRADHLKKVLNAVSVYVTVILDDSRAERPRRPTISAKSMPFCPTSRPTWSAPSSTLPTRMPWRVA